MSNLIIPWHLWLAMRIRIKVDFQLFKRWKENVKYFRTSVKKRYEVHYQNRFHISTKIQIIIWSCLPIILIIKYFNSSILLSNLNSYYVHYLISVFWYTILYIARLRNILCLNSIQQVFPDFALTLENRYCTSRLDKKKAWKYFVGSTPTKFEQFLLTSSFFSNVVTKLITPSSSLDRDVNYVPSQYDTVKPELAATSE